jgi:hypothetical protein
LKKIKTKEKGNEKGTRKKYGKGKVNKEEKIEIKKMERNKEEKKNVEIRKK